MTQVTVQIKALHRELGERFPWPQRMSEEAAGIDVAAAIESPITLAPLERRLVPCGFSMALPKGFECQVRPRSGLAFKSGVTVLNAPGTIDSDYRGEVKVLLVNLGNEPSIIEPGQRIAQLVVAAVALPAVDVVTQLQETERGSGGFGSTG